MKKWKSELQKKWKIKTFRIWLMIFCAIFLVQIFSWSVLMTQVNHILKIQTDEVYTNVLNVLSSYCDNDLNSAYSMLDVMALDEAIKKKCSNTTMSAGDTVMQNELVRRQLAYYKVQHSFIDDIFIWFENTDKIISSNTVAESKLFYDIYGNVSMTFEQWKEALQQRYFKCDVMWENQSGKDTLYILHSKTGANHSKITIAIKFKESYLQDLTDRFYSNKFAAIEIRNKEGEPLAESAVMDVGIPQRTVSNTSGLSGWSYIAYVSEEGIKLYENVIFIILILFFVVLVATFGAFLIFLRFNVNPFMELSQYINSMGDEAFVDGSEYMHIKDRFDEIIRKQKANEHSFVEQMNGLKVSYLIQILEGKLAMNENNRQLLKKMQLEYLYEPCAVMMIPDGEAIRQQENCMGVLEKYGVGTAQNSMLYGCSFFVESAVVCLFRVEAEPEEMRRRAIALAKAVSHSRDDEYIFAVSSVKPDCKNIKNAYEQAKYVLQSARQLSVSGIMFFDEIQEKVKENVRDSKEDVLVRQVREYIEKHYAESDLTIELLCETLGKSASYVSQLYKKRTGQNILYDLNLVRIERAKQLLAQADISIDEIGRECGFINSNSFIRVFKKYENMTPGRYKDFHMTGKS